MLQSVRNLFGYRIAAKDGQVGGVSDFLFDDRSWAVRYLVVDTGNWLPGRRVLIYPEALGQPSHREKAFPVDLTTELIESSPPLVSDMPVSAQYELELHRHYSSGAFGAGVPPVHEPTSAREDGDSHLRSASEVLGYGIAATDGGIGHVDDFVVDDEAWVVRYAIVDTKNWLPGKHVLVACEWLRAIDWRQSEVQTILTRGQIESSPEFDPAASVDREYEERLYHYYARPAYWSAIDSDGERR